MKKLLYSLMIAAATLVVGCSEPEGPNNGSGTGNNEFYGLAMDSADVTVVGKDEYVIQMYNIATVEEQQMMTSIASAHVIIPGVSEDGIIPEGTYDIVAGEKGATPYYYKGSFFWDMYSSNPFDALLTGKLEVKHIAKGHRLTILSDGVNVETSATIKDLDFRYEGQLEYSSNETPMVSFGAADPNEEEPDPYFFYRGPFSEDANLWEMQVMCAYDSDNGVVYYYDILVLTSAEGTLANGIPTGTYPINLSFEPGTVLAAYYDKTGYLNGSMLVYEYSVGNGVYTTLFGGELDIVNNGDGTYEIELNYYNYYSIPSVASYSGVCSHIDYSDGVDMLYYGDNNWQVYCWDMTNGICTALDVYSAEGNTFADGLAAGTYTVAETSEPMTIVPGVYDATAGAVGGSAFWNLDFSGIYDVVSSGTMEVSKEGDVYTVELNLSGDTKIKDYTWECTGEVSMEDKSDEVGDNTDPEEGGNTEPEGGNTESTPEVDNDDNAAVLKAAPLKSAVAKKAPVRSSAYRNCGKIHKSDINVVRNRAF